MVYIIIKALISGILIAAASELAKRNPALGALVVSLPLVSILVMIWLWRDTGDAARIIDHSYATFWLVLPSLPMFLTLPLLMTRGVTFGLALLLSGLKPKDPALFAKNISRLMVDGAEHFGVNNA